MNRRGWFKSVCAGVAGGLGSIVAKVSLTNRRDFDQATGVISFEPCPTAQEPKLLFDFTNANSLVTDDGRIAVKTKDGIRFLQLM